MLAGDRKTSPDPKRGGARHPAWLRRQSFAGGSMGPKVEAVCRFVQATGRRGAIGPLEDLAGLIDGAAGTQTRADGPEVMFRD